MRPLLVILRGALTCGLLLVWAVAAHRANAGHGNPELNAALALIPLLLAGALLLRPMLHRPALAAAAAIAVLVVLAWRWPQLRQNVPALYFFQHLGAHLALGVLFGRSLLGGAEPLVTRMARHLQDGKVSPRNARYTHRVTMLWTIFFFGSALVSTLLFWLTPITVWSAYANFLTAPLVVLVIGLEHLWRLHVLPKEERPSLASVLRVYSQRRSFDASGRDRANAQHP